MMSHYPGNDTYDKDDEKFYKILQRELERNGIKHNGSEIDMEDTTQNANSVTTPVAEPQKNLIVMNPNKDAIHMKLKIKGSPDKIMFFHWLMAELDPDWPYSAKRRNPHLKVYCTDCKGYIYRDNEYSPEEIKLIAKQIDENQRLRGSLTVKVKMFTRLSNCADVATIAAAQVDDEDGGEPTLGVN